MYDVADDGQGRDTKITDPLLGYVGPAIDGSGSANHQHD